MKIMQFILYVFFLQLINKIKCQQYNCTVHYTENKKNLTTVTMLKQCPLSDQCQYSNNSYNLKEHTHYLEKESGEVRISFSWKPKFINTSAPFCGFKIITRERISDIHNSTFFCPNISMLSLKSDFYFECEKTALPEQSYFLTISPLPVINYELMLNFSTKVPPCHDITIASSSECNQASPKIDITRNFSCVNRTFEVSYEFPTKTDSVSTVLASFRVCYKPTPSSHFCMDIDKFPILEERPLIDKVNVTLPRNISTSDFYFVDIFQDSGIRYETNVTDIFRASANCIYPENTKPKGFPGHFAAVIAAVVLSVVILCVLGYKTKCSVNAISSLVKPTYEKEPIVPHSQTLYVVFVGDHAKHQDVVLKLTAYLKCDLGFQVLFELYQTEEVLKDPSSWMETSLSRADKVLFIWSPEAAGRWEQRDKHTSLTDMFTPVLRRAVVDMWKAGNYDKYFFLNFDYCDSGIIPARFKSLQCNYFNLMDDFDQFYLKLMGLKASGCVQFCIDESFCELSDSEYGTVFLEAVDEMCKYAAEHRNWFEETQISSCKEQPYASYTGSSSLLNDATKLTNELVIIPPSPIRVQNCLSQSDQSVSSADSAFHTDYNTNSQTAFHTDYNTNSQSFNSAVEINETGLQSELRTYVISHHAPTKIQFKMPVENSIKEFSDENHRTFKMPVEHSSQEYGDVENGKWLQPLNTKQLAFGQSENDFLLENKHANNQISTLQPIVVIAPKEIDTDPMVSLTNLNNCAQVTRL